MNDASDFSKAGLVPVTTSVLARLSWWRRYRSVKPGVVTWNDRTEFTGREAPLRHSGIVEAQVVSAAKFDAVSQGFGPPDLARYTSSLWCLMNEPGLSKDSRAVAPRPDRAQNVALPAKAAV